jgi:hypothetical protein
MINLHIDAKRGSRGLSRVGTTYNLPPSLNILIASKTIISPHFPPPYNDYSYTLGILFLGSPLQPK